MAGRRGRDRGAAARGLSGGSPKGRGKPFGSAQGRPGRGKREYEYVGGESDLRYVKQAHERLRQQGMRRWVMRIVVVAAVVFVTWMWGPGVVRRLRRQAQQTAGEFQKAGKQMKEGTARRAGKGVDVDNP